MRHEDLSTALLLCLAVIFGLIGPDTLVAGDWASWRGPNQNGASTETNLPSSGEDVLWRVPFGARSTPAIFNGRVFGINLAGEGVHEQERVFALDLVTGKVLWEHRFNVFHTDIPNSRVGWSNVAVDPETGNIYAHGVQGMFLCLNRDGKLLWSRSLTETLGRISGYGGRTNTPVIDEDRVIISFLNSSFGPQGKGRHRFLAMDKLTGELLWWSEPGGKPLDTTYSTPVIATVNGRRLLIGGNADGGVYALDSRTGEKVWGFQLSRRGLNSSIVVEGDRVYATHSEENVDSTKMGRVVCIDATGRGDVTKTHEVWRQDGIPAGYASPLLHDGRLYVLTNFGVLHCFDAQSGKEYWQHIAGRVGKGSPVWADGKIYVPTVNANFVILRDLGDEAETLSTMTFESESGAVVELFGSPAVANGRVVFSTSDETVCLGKSDAGPVPNATLASVRKPTIHSDAPAAKLLVLPAEVLIEPGERVAFKASAFDELGQPLGQRDAEWSFAGPGGVVDSSGTFVAETNTGSVGMITAKVGDLSATARVRIVPGLPITEDFESYDDGDMISWWIGVSKAKHALEAIDGNTVLKKLNTRKGPPLDRSRVYITPPLKAGYTVQADVLGVKEGRRRGDVGLINARYRLELFGRLNRLRVMSWVPGPRFEKVMDFSWDSDRWYTMKFLVVPDGDQARLYAKVWPRNEAEPADWTLEAVDPQPNLEGSAGIYAYSALAPVYYDNIKITR